MSATVILTGAGASKPLGYPTTAEFFNDSNSIPDSHLDVFNGVKAQIGKTAKVDVEEILRILQPADDCLKTKRGRFLGRKLTDNWASKVQELAKHIRDRCFHLYGPYPKEADVRTLYVAVLDLCGWRKIWLSLFLSN